MGMYDNIEDVQVKCFYLAYYHKNEGSPSGINLSGGGLRNYGKGSTVPYKTYYYNYSPNFMIYNHDFIFESEEFIIIRKGKVKKIIYDINKLKDEDFNGLENVINYYGNFLNIKNIEDIKKYKEDMLYFRNLRDKVSEKKNKLFKLSIKYNQMKRKVIPMEEGITIEKADELCLKYLEEYKEEDERIKDQITELEKCLLKPLYKEENEHQKEEDLGSLIYAYERLKTTLKTKPGPEEWEQQSYQRNLENMNYLLVEFRELILENKNLVENFLKLQEKTEEEDLRKIIEEINTCDFYN